MRIFLVLCCAVFTTPTVCFAQAALQKVDVEGAQPAVEATNGTQSKRVQELIASGKLDEARAAASQVVQSVSSLPKDSPDLEQLVREEFSIRQQLQMNEIQQLKVRIKSLEERVQRQEESRETLIKQRIESLKSNDSEVPTDDWSKRHLGSRSLEKSVAETSVPAPKVANRGIYAGFDPASGTWTHSLGSRKAKNYRIRPGDTLGILIPQVLGQKDEKPPIHEDITGQRPPAMGYPITVREDGTISLPLVPIQDVAGQSLAEIEKILRKAYIEDKAILTHEATILVSVIRKVDDVVTVRQTGNSRAVDDSFAANDSGIGRMRSPSEFVEKFTELARKVKNNAFEYSRNHMGVEDVLRPKKQFLMLKQELEHQIRSIQLEINAAKSETALHEKEIAKLQELHSKKVVIGLEVDRAAVAASQSRSKLEQLMSLHDLYAQATPDALNDVKIVDDRLALIRKQKQTLLDQQTQLLEKKANGAGAKELLKFVYPDKSESALDEVSEMKASERVKKFLDSTPGALKDLDEDIVVLEQKKAELAGEPKSAP